MMTPSASRPGTLHVLEVPYWKLLCVHHRIGLQCLNEFNEAMKGSPGAQKIVPPGKS